MNREVLRDRLKASGLADEGSIQGCSSAEINAIREVAGVFLPSDYCDFMSLCGMGAGRFLRDLDIFYPDVLGLKSVAIEILNDYPDFGLSLPDDAFVFAVRQGEQFMMFRGISKIPSIFFYMSGDTQITEIAGTFWNVIERELVQAEINYASIRGTPYDLS